MPFWRTVEEEESWLERANALRAERERIAAQMDADPQATNAIVARAAELTRRHPGLPPGLYVAAAQFNLADASFDQIATELDALDDAADAEPKSRWAGGLLSDVGAAFNSADDFVSRNVIKQGSRFVTAALAYPVQVGYNALRSLPTTGTPGDAHTAPGDMLWRGTSLGQFGDSPGETGSGYFPSGKAEADRRRYEARVGAPSAIYDRSGDRHLWTPGRSIVNAFGWDPDEGGGKVVSGIADAATLWKDPAAPALARGGSNLVRGSRTFAGAARAEHDIGLLRGIVERIHGPTAQVWLDSERGQRFIAFATESDDFADLAHRLPRMPRPVVAALADATDHGAVRAILDGELGIGTPIIPKVRWSGAAGTYGYELRSRFTPRVKRLIDRIPGRFVDTENPHDFSIGVERFMRTALVPDDEISRVAKQAAQLRPGDRQGAYEVIAETARVTQRALVDQGNDPRVARDLVSFFNDDATKITAAFVDDIGDGYAATSHMVVGGDMLASNPAAASWQVMDDASGLLRPIADGDVITMGDALLYNELLSRTVHLPDYRALRRATTRGKLRTITQSTGWYDRDAPLHSVIGVLDAGHSLWRKAVLFRLGFSLRNLGEIQAAMGARGNANLFRHPGEFLAHAIGRGKHLATDVRGNVFDEVIEEGGRLVTEGDPYFIAASAESAREARQVAREARLLTGGHTLHSIADTTYAPSLVGEAARLAEDPVARRVAGAVRTGDPAALEAVRTAFWDGDLARFRTDLVRRTAVENGRTPTLRHLIGTSRDASDIYIGQIVDRIHIKTGGDPALLDAIADRGIHVVRAKKGSDAARFLDRAYAEALAEHPDLSRRAFDQAVAYEHAAGRADFGEFAEEIRVVKVRLGNGRRPLPEMVEHVRGLVDAGSPGLPRQVKGPVSWRPGEREVNRLERIVDAGWDMLATTPANRLGLHPTFRQIYAQELARLAPFSDDAAQNAIRKYLPDGVRPGTGALPEGGVALSLTEADRIAKANTLAEMRTMFYELASKSQVGDVMRFLAPFGDAWANGIRRWGRFVSENPATLHRTRQVLQGGESAGFFTEDPTTGEMVFVYPGSRLLTRGLTGVEWDLTGRVSGVNMIAQAYPGVGPAIQIAASQALNTPILRDIYSDPDNRWIRDLISPYGEPDTSGGIFEALFPAWLQRARSTGLVPFLGPSKDQSRVQAGLKADVMKFLYSKHGDEVYDLKDRAGRLKLDRDATTIAAKLGFIRSVAAFAAPSAPTWDRKVVDADGDIVSLYALTEAYRVLQDEDFASADGAFLSMFGIKNLLAMQSASMSKVIGLDSSLDQETFIRERPELRDRYPNTWALLDPTQGTFDFGVYRSQLERGERHSLLPDPDDHDAFDRWLALAYNRVAELTYRNAVSATSEMSARQRDDYLRIVRAQIHAQFDSWRDDTLEPAREDNWRLVDELGEMSGDPDLENTPMSVALRRYFAARDQVIAFQRADGAVGFGPGGTSLNTSVAYAPQIAWLYSYAERLFALSPDAFRAWERVLSREDAFGVLEEVPVG